MEIEEAEPLLFAMLGFANEKEKPVIIAKIFQLWLKNNGFKITSITDDKKIVIIGENNNDI